jgi:hypothetical protein
VATTITAGATTIVADAIAAYSSTSEHGNKIHGRIATGLVDVVLREAGPRAGRLELVIDAEAAAYAAETALRGPAVWTLTSDELASIAMSFVVADGGNVSRELEPTTGATWLVAFDWQEITE